MNLPVCQFPVAKACSAARSRSGRICNVRRKLRWTFEWGIHKKGRNMERESRRPGGSHPRAKLILLALVASLIALFAITSPASAHGFKLDYVALGDSYTAGPGIPDMIAVDTVPGCGQSSHNYPHELAAMASFVHLTDVSCGGATTENMAGPQVTAYGTAPPQLNALNRGTDVVTLMIGGNDNGFGEIIGNCISPFPTGDKCQHIYDLPSGDVLQQRIAATAVKVGAVFDQIHARAPHARVIFVGYPTILPPGGSCYSANMPITPSDAAYLEQFGLAQNASLKAVAHAHHAGYGDSYKLSLGHDVCQPPDVRWIEGLIPTSPSIPVHPNAKGEKSMARAALSGFFN
jgi:lysophospholipase L1-like esterase